jgi:hypothetical protein
VGGEDGADGGFLVGGEGEAGDDFRVGEDVRAAGLEGELVGA